MIRLKDFVLPSAVFQAPMASCTDLAFRLVAREKGMKFGFAEMVSAEALVRGHRKTLKLLARSPGDQPLGVQIVGAKPDVMGTAAGILEEMGFSLLDINLGCPVPKITGAGGGCALMKEPETAGRIFRSVVRRVRRIPVTVKMRLGLVDGSGQEAIRIARLAEDSGLDAVTIHGRTRAQGYSGPADYGAVARVKEAVSIPVFGNGDVFDKASALRLMRVAGVDGVVIGRGGLGNPWIYNAVEAALDNCSEPAVPDFNERRRTIMRHMDLQIQTDEAKALYHMRRIACWYFKEMPGVARLRDCVHRASGFEELRELITQFGTSLN